jgi:hypothetical protein
MFLLHYGHLKNFFSTKMKINLQLNEIYSYICIGFVKKIL